MSNKISVNGALGKDAELKHTKNGQPVLEFSLADSLSRKNDNGDWTDVRETIWWRVAVWGALGASLAPLLTKGARVEVSGPAQIRTYSKTDGTQGVSYEITAQTIGINDKQRAQQPQQQFGNSAAQPQPQFGDSAAQTAFDQYNAAAEGGWNDAPPF